MAQEVTPALSGVEGLFEMRGIGKTFGATVALDAVDFAVAAGEVCALVGQNGAGKSTLMAILAGALASDRGEMRLAGAPFAPRDPLDARRAGIAMIYQELSLAPHLSVMENIMLGVEPVKRGVVQRDRMRQTARSALAQLGHADIAPDALVRDLQPAAQQLVEIARALAFSTSTRAPERACSTAFVTSSDTKSSASATESSRPHSTSVCLTNRRAVSAGPTCTRCSSSSNA